eukprot:Pgem_evm1s20100
MPKKYKESLFHEDENDEKDYFTEKSRSEKTKSVGKNKKTKVAERFEESDDEGSHKNNDMWEGKHNLSKPQDLKFV